jgi:hypothetical protein
LAVQFRAANEPPRDPFADPRLSQQLLESPPGHVVVAVEVPVDAAAGASFFDVTCLNAEGGGIEQLSVCFLVTDLPATGLSVAPLLAGE